MLVNVVDRVYLYEELVYEVYKMEDVESWCLGFGLWVKLWLLRDMVSKFYN